MTQTPRDVPLTLAMGHPLLWEAWLAGFRAGRARTAGLGARPRELPATTPGLTPTQITHRARASWGWPCYPPIRAGKLDWTAHTHTPRCRMLARAG